MPSSQEVQSFETDSLQVVAIQKITKVDVLAHWIGATHPASRWGSPVPTGAFNHMRKAELRGFTFTAVIRQCAALGDVVMIMQNIESTTSSCDSRD